MRIRIESASTPENVMGISSEGDFGGDFDVVFTDGAIFNGRFRRELGRTGMLFAAHRDCSKFDECTLGERARDADTLTLLAVYASIRQALEKMRGT